MRSKLILIVLSVSLCRAAPALVNHAKKNESSNASTTPAVDCTGANFLVANMTDLQNVAGEPGTVTDSGSNTWTQLTSRTTGSGNVVSTLWYAKNVTGGASQTVTWTISGGGSAFKTLDFACFSGVDTTSPFDVENGGAGAPVSQTTMQPGSITPSQNGELIIAGVGVNNTPGDTVSIDSSFTITDSNALIGGAAPGGGLAYLVQGTAGAVNPTWTWSANVSAYSANIASFKAAASATGVKRKGRVF